MDKNTTRVDGKLHEQSPFIAIIIVTLLLTITSALFIKYQLSLEFNPTSPEAYKNLKDVFSIPIYILSCGMTILAFYAVVYRTDQTAKQMELTLEQMENSRKSEKLARYERKIQNITDLLFKIQEKPVAFELGVKSLMADLGVSEPITQKYSENKDFISIEFGKNEDKKTLQIRAEANCFDTLNSYSKLAGIPAAKKTIFAENKYLIRSDLATFRAQMNDLLNAINLLLRNGYDVFTVRQTISMFYEHSKLLYSLGEFDEFSFLLMGSILSLPFDNAIEYSINLKEELVKELNRKHHLNLDCENVDLTHHTQDKITAAVTYQILDKKTQKSYFRDGDFQWRSIK